MKGDVFISIDIECDGPIPGPHSMISLGAAAFDNDGRIIGTFEANLKALVGANPHETTMKDFWAKHPEAWKRSTENPVDPEKVMLAFDKWVTGLPGTEKRAVCSPVGFDFTFVYWYLTRFVGTSCLDFKAIDMRSYLAGMLGLAYQYSGKPYYKQRWKDTRFAHTHCAIDDALEQGTSFMRMRAENLYGKTACYAAGIAFENSWNKLKKDSKHVVRLTK